MSFNRSNRAHRAKAGVRPPCTVRSGRRCPARTRRTIVFLCSALALCAGRSAYAWKGDFFQPFISYGDYYDNNVFYVPKHGTMFLIQNGVPRVLVGPSSDTFRVLKLGTNMDWRPGRQQITLLASESLVRFSRFSAINYDGSRLQSQWNWRFGSRWDGTIGASRHVTQSSFSDLQTFTVVNNIYTERRAFAKGGFWLDPRWKFGVDTATSILSNSSAFESYLNYDQNSVGPFIEYRTQKGSTLTTELRTINARYPNQQFFNGSAVDNSYRENELNIIGSWAATGKTQLRGRLGFIERRNQDLSQRNFSGVTGSLTANYMPTGSTSLSLRLYRRSAGVDVGYASFVLDTGESLSAAWQMTGTLTLQGSVGHDQFNYQGDPGIIFGFPHRTDNVQNASLDLQYRPSQLITADIGATTGYRVSSYSFYNYHFDMIFANLKFKP